MATIVAGGATALVVRSVIQTSRVRVVGGGVRSVTRVPELIPLHIIVCHVKIVVVQRVNRHHHPLTKKQLQQLQTPQKTLLIL